MSLLRRFLVLGTLLMIAGCCSTNGGERNRACEAALDKNYALAEE